MFHLCLIQWNESSSTQLQALWFRFQPNKTAARNTRKFSSCLKWNHPPPNHHFCHGMEIIFLWIFSEQDSSGMLPFPESNPVLQFLDVFCECVQWEICPSSKLMPVEVPKDQKSLGVQNNSSQNSPSKHLQTISRILPTWNMGRCILPIQLHRMSTLRSFHCNDPWIPSHWKSSATWLDQVTWFHPPRVFTNHRPVSHPHPRNLSIWIFLFPIEKLLAKEDAGLYNNINQGCLTVDNMDDKGEMRLADVGISARRATLTTLEQPRRIPTNHSGVTPATSRVVHPELRWKPPFLLQQSLRPYIDVYRSLRCLVWFCKPYSCFIT